MNSKGHLIISIIKSVIRIISCLWSAATQDVLPLTAGFLVAEALGITEELVDKR